MPIEPVFEKISAKEKAGSVVCQVKVECKTEVPASAVEKVLNDNVCATVTLGDVVNGRAEFTGKATFFICYVTQDGIRKCECGAEIKDSLVSEIISESDSIKLSWETDKVETDLTGVKMSVSAYLTVKGEVIKKTEYPALTGGEGIYCNFAEITTVKSCGTVSSGYTTEEEFELKYPVAEVLAHKAEVSLTQVQCGVGTVIVDGEIYLSEILLQSGDKSDIIRENRVIPFRAEAECEDAMPQLSATCRAYVKSLKTDVGVDEEKNVSSLTALITLDLRGEAYLISQENFATDAFNTENELSLLRSRINFNAESAPYSTYTKLTGRAAIDDIGTARVIAVANEKIETVSAEKKDGNVNVSGTVNLNTLFMSDDGKVFSRKTEVPFDASLPCDVKGNVKIVATPKCSTVKLITLSEIECETEAVFTVYDEQSFAFDVVSTVETGEEKPVTDAAVSVYIPLAGEGLWELSKRLNVCPETLVATNPELQFPLTGKERIVVFRQK